MKKGTPKTAAGKLATKNAIKERRREVARMMRLRMTGTDIAERLQVSQGTVSNDCKAIREEWAAEARRDMGERIAEDLAVLAKDEERLRDLLEDAEHDAKTLNDPENCNYARENVAKLYDRILKIQERRSKLLGLDAPTKTEAKVQAQIQHEPSVAFEKLAQDPEARRLADELAVRLYGPGETKS